ncbi:MAG: hypothetical protein ACLP3K_04610 [Candidatus Acidiferrales bacterium]
MMDRFSTTAVQILAAISFLGTFAGLILEPFLKWIGHPVYGPQPLWFTVACGCVFLVLLLLDWHENCEDARMDKLIEALKTSVGKY